MAPHALSTRKTKKGFFAFSILLVFAVLVTACGGSQTQVSHKQVPLSIVPNTGGDYTRVFNPYQVSTTTYYGAQGLIYETLLYFNRLDGSEKPWLATSYHFSSDSTNIAFTLRQGVKWSDGQPFTSDDVVFTLNLLKKYPGMDLNSLWQFIKSVSAADASTVQVTLNKPLSFPSTIIAMLVMRASMRIPTLLVQVLTYSNHSHPKSTFWTKTRTTG